MRNNSLYDIVTTNAITFDFLLKLIFPSFPLHTRLLFLFTFATITSKTTVGSFILILLFFLSLFSFLIFFFDLIQFKIVFLIWNLLPFSNIDRIVSIDIHLIFTNLFQFLPLLFLLFTHDIAHGRLVLFHLSHIVYETRITCLLTDVNSPHLKLTTLWRLIFLIWYLLLFFFLLCSEILGKYKVLFFSKINRSPEFPLRSFCYELRNSGFTTCDDWLSIVLNLFFKSWSLFSFRNISRRQ